MGAQSLAVNPDCLVVILKNDAKFLPRHSNVIFSFRQIISFVFQIRHKRVVINIVTLEKGSGLLLGEDIARILSAGSEPVLKLLVLHTHLSQTGEKVIGPIHVTSIVFAHVADHGSDIRIGKRVALSKTLDEALAHHVLRIGTDASHIPSKLVHNVAHIVSIYCNTHGVAHFDRLAFAIWIVGTRITDAHIHKLFDGTGNKDAIKYSPPSRFHANIASPFVLALEVVHNLLCNGSTADSDNVLEELFDDAAKDMAEKLKGANAPVPDEIGYELTENDEVIAEIEIAWTESKIAYLTEDQMEYEEILTDKGWTIINNDTAVSKDMFGGVN